MPPPPRPLGSERPAHRASNVQAAAAAEAAAATAVVERLGLLRAFLETVGLRVLLASGDLLLLPRLPDAP